LDVDMCKPELSQSRESRAQSIPRTLTANLKLLNYDEINVAILITTRASRRSVQSDNIYTEHYCEVSYTTIIVNRIQMRGKQLRLARLKILSTITHMFSLQEISVTLYKISTILPFSETLDEVLCLSPKMLVCLIFA